MINRIIDLYESLKESFVKTISDIKGECTFNIPDVSTFTKEQNTLFEEYEKQTQDISGIAEKEAFINGLRYGANFILAILEEK